MAKNELGYLDYVKAAFNAKVKVPGLGKVPFNWLGLIGIGAVSLAFPFIAMIGAGAELFYLYVLSSDKRFKNFVKAEQLQKLKNSEEDIKRVAVMQLPVKDRQSYYALLEKCNKIRQLAENYSTGMVSDSLRDSYDSLNELLDVSLKLLSTKNVINKFVQTDEIETVEEKIKSIQKLEANETSESAKKSYQSTLEILNKRLVVLKNAEEKLKSINIDL